MKTGAFVIKIMLQKPVTGRKIPPQNSAGHKALPYGVKQIKNIKLTF